MTARVVVDPRASELAALRRRATPAEALAFFDRLPPMPATEMLGAWEGAGLHTGHPLDGLLEAVGWRGKRFDGPEAVHPLVFGKPGATFSVNPALAPLALGHPGLARSASRFATPALALLSTREPKARLRMTEFRGVVTATMIYDQLPINDVFRRVDADTVLGLMDQRGAEAPDYFFFTLTRERSGERRADPRGS
ncbi:GXWXG protein [Roseiarcus fermentans]|uniref:GXWXG protein n=1 Tax=Roseiarcus fermentans TaxID=1473586 RepID=A0A366EX04_9HYPH|nr:DUF4334 domain-containing protein [Roseiarcus fermentans]RBP06230.1 GXWXG protein [Roseiarcus fermentans]